MNMRAYSAGSGNLDSYDYPGHKQRRTSNYHESFFTEFTVRKFALYAVTMLYVVITGCVALYEPLILLPCDHDDSQKEYGNPDYTGSHCNRLRHVKLLYLTREECSFARRLVSSVLLGGLIGWERRQADRPAGIRTMALVSLGASLFTICSTFAFESGPNEWYASRISAAIPSGVGFLGAGLIFKEQKNDDAGGQNHVVHGLTTAASLWLSAAVGIACGGEMYFAASFGTAVLLLLLRFGPRHDDSNDEDDKDDVDDLRVSVIADPHGVLPKNLEYGATSARSLATTGAGTGDGHSETQSLVSDSLRARHPNSGKKKSRASLSTMV